MVFDSQNLANRELPVLIILGNPQTPQKTFGFANRFFQANSFFHYSDILANPNPIWLGLAWLSMLLSHRGTILWRALLLTQLACQSTVPNSPTIQWGQMQGLNSRSEKLILCFEFCGRVPVLGSVNVSRRDHRLCWNFEDL